MKKAILILSIALVGTTAIHAQVSNAYCGRYKTSLDVPALRSSLADSVQSGRTTTSFTMTQGKASASSSDFHKEVYNKAAEIAASHMPQGYSLASANMTMQSTSYGTITVKSNRIENANPQTKKTEVLYEWEDSNVSATRGGYQIVTTSGAMLTLERVNASTIRIPELYLVLTRETK